MRNGVGLIDVGTLGKIEVHGPDAAEFLDRVYAGRFANLKVGMTRYGLMLDEAGVDHRRRRHRPARAESLSTSRPPPAARPPLFREFGRLATWWGLRLAW